MVVVHLRVERLLADFALLDVRAAARKFRVTASPANLPLRSAQRCGVRSNLRLP